MESILFIGDVRGYARLICYMLLKGYRVFYKADFASLLALVDQENVCLIIVGNTAGREDSAEDLSLTDLTRLGIPVILTGGNALGNTIIERLQDHVPIALQEADHRKDINDAIECFLSGEQEETQSDCLVFQQERGFISLGLSEGESVQRVHGRIRKAVAFMERKYGENISLDQIARSAHLNPYYFCRLFKKQLGTTCSRYLSSLRVEKAKQLLKGTDLSVTEICFDVGFNSLTHFERVFKGLEGVTPSAYRQSL